MSDFVGSIALIRHPELLEHQWLAHWNDGAQHYDFVTAERLEKESWRECLDREIAWSLNLRRGKDYIISSTSRLHLEIELNLPVHGIDTFFVVEFYITDLYGGVARDQLDRNPSTCWMSGREVLDGITDQGKTINPSLVALLAKADVIKRDPR